MAPIVTPTGHSVRVLPGEPWVVFQWLVEGSHDSALHLIRPDGTGAHVIPAEKPAFHPDWSRDGKHVAFDTDDASMWLANPDGSEPTEIVSCPGRQCHLTGFPALSPDGTEVAYVREDNGSPAYVEVSNVLTGARRVVARPVAGAGRYIEAGAPRWSPDGERLVVTITYWTDPPTEPMLGSSIAVVDADGSTAGEPVLLTEPEMHATYPDWSPDAEWIVFNTYDLAGFQTTTNAANLYSIHPDGSRLTQITRFDEQDTRATQASWTPDGTKIIFTWVGRDAGNDFGDRRIAFIEPDGSNLTVLAQNGTHPRLRPEFVTPI